MRHDAAPIKHGRSKHGGSGANRRVVALFLVVIAANLAAAQERVLDVAQRAKRQVLVSIPDRKLAVLENGEVLRTFAVSVGSPASPSPTGKFEIVNRLANPTYYHAGVVIPAGKQNPLGPRWVGLSKHGYGIHGTSVPGSIGKAASHGCIRLRNREVVEFATLVKVGDTVEIRSERDEEITRVFGGDAGVVMASSQATSSSSTAVSGQ
jgi:lipoprotein-anchoring transpeptidase ErfK/SrfK